MRKEKKKLTEHTIKSVIDCISLYLSSCEGKGKEIAGIIFSNEGAKGREPLFDVSYSGTKDIFAYWEDQRRGIICISAERPGYEIRAPKNMSNFFESYYCQDFLITYLDVTHLDVSHSDDFRWCFNRFGDNDFQFGAPVQIIGLETWDVCNGRNFDGCFAHAFSNNIHINLDLSNWQFNNRGAIITMSFMFLEFAQNAKSVSLDVSNWNVENVADFFKAFADFGINSKNVQIKGIEDWRLKNANTNLSNAFKNFAPMSQCCLDLSKWTEGCEYDCDISGFSKGTFFRIKEPVKQGKKN